MTKPKVLLVDIDGTVADCEHRRKYIDEEIRVGDTVYVRDEPNSKSNPFIYEGEDSFGHSVIRGKFKDKPCELHVVKELLRKKLDYKKFFEEAVNDPPLDTTIDIVRKLGGYYDVIFMSGRPEDYRKITQEWLSNHVREIPYWDYGRYTPQLIMRPSGDMRPDHVVKKELYEKFIEPYYTVKLVLDDRTQVVRMWREALGLTCFQVAPGDF